MASVALSIVVIAGSALTVSYVRRPPIEDLAVRFTFSPPEGLAFADVTTGGQLAISPDGQRLAFVATGPDGTERLWVQPFDSSAGQGLSGTEGASYPFWSPDSRFVGFFAQGKLKRVEATGGPPQTLSDAVLPRGGTWNGAGVIVFSANAGHQLYRVSSAGGDATPLALDQPNRESYWPDFLPDGRHFVYFARRQEPGIYIGSLDSRDTTLLAAGYVGVEYAAPGYLLLLTGGAPSETAGTLMAQRFDSSRLQLTGEPVPLAEQVAIRPRLARGVFSASENERLVYGMNRGQTTQLIWFDRGGNELASLTKPGRYQRFALSPDEKTVAVELIDPQVQAPDIWLIETTRGVTSRFTFDPAAERMAVWSPDGSRIVFSSPREGNPPSLFQKASSGAGREERLFGSDVVIQPTDWSRDGRLVVYARQDPKTQWDLYVLPAASDPTSGDRGPVPYLRTEFNEHHGHLSPDGRWMAYASDESGSWEVFVRAFPVPDNRWQISTAGGAEPRWRRDGKELFYVSADGTLMAVAVQLEADFKASAPRALFRARFASFGAEYWRPVYVPAAEGQRFLINTVINETSPSPVSVILNWPALLRR